MAIHDLSCVGKCSLSVCLPILSAMGAEVAALPTALLSTHTGGLSGYSNLDLTDEMARIAAHWASLGLKFDAIYSGWLGSARQSALVASLFDEFGADGALRLVDPVMGDHGKLYSTFDDDRVRGMRALCRKADLLTPNLTEAAFLLDEPYRDGPLSEADARALCLRLTALGPASVVITGVSTGADTLGAASLDAQGNFALHETPRVPGIWHGTGDIFSAVLLGALLRGDTLAEGVRLAVRFVHDAIERTRKLGTDPRFGVDFERGLGALTVRT